MNFIIFGPNDKQKIEEDFYITLSYVWKQGTRQITDWFEKEWVITEYMSAESVEAFHYLKQQHVYLWYDQKSIRQEDPEHKKWNIEMMRNIYDHAQFTIAFVPEMYN